MGRNEKGKEMEAEEEEKENFWGRKALRRMVECKKGEKRYAKNKRSR